MNIFLMGYHGYQNTGDDAMGRGVVNYLRSNDIILVLAHFSGDSFKDTMKKVWWSDVIIVPGGTHLRNWGKGWLWQSSRMLMFGCLCRLLGKKFYMCNVGIDGRGWEWLAHRIANKVTIRDRETFDSAALMNFDLSGVERKKIIGVNLTPINKIYYNDKAKDGLIAVSVWSAIRTWLDKHPDWSVKFISFNGNNKYSDNPLNEVMSKVMGATFVPWQNNPVQTLKEIAECSVMIGMRYHACVFAALAGIPLIGIESYPSIRHFIGANYRNIPLRRNYIIETASFTAYFEESMRTMDNNLPNISLEQMRELAKKGVEL